METGTWNLLEIRNARVCVNSSCRFSTICKLSFYGEAFKDKRKVTSAVYMSMKSTDSYELVHKYISVELVWRWISYLPSFYYSSELKLMRVHTRTYWAG